MTTKHIFTLLVGVLLLSCNAENKQNDKNTTSKIKKKTGDILSSYNEKVEQKAQLFEINANKHQTIKGQQGTLVTFPLGCFGKVQGKIKIELIECYSIQAMLFNGLSTQTTDGKLLESEGMIYLNATNEKGDTLEIKNGRIKLQMPTKQMKEGIQIFEGIESKNMVNWNLSSEKIENPSKIKNKSPYVIDELDSVSFTQIKTVQSEIVIDKQIKNEFLVNYVFNISKMGWINCDRFVEGGNKDLFVSVGEGQENVSLYLVLDKLNSNVMPRNPKAVNGQFEFRNIPVKEPFTLVALATKGDNIYFGMAKYTTNEGGVVNCPELKPVTRQELTDLLLKKFGKDIWSRPLA